MLIPKRVKYRKQYRGRMKGQAHRGNKVAHGDVSAERVQGDGTVEGFRCERFQHRQDGRST